VTFTLNVNTCGLDPFSFTTSQGSCGTFDITRVQIPASVGGSTITSGTTQQTTPGGDTTITNGRTESFNCAVLRKEMGRDVPKIVHLLIGNPLIMKEMAKHVPDAGSYAPITVLVDERADGVHLSYDRMASFLAPYENRDALEVARDLDSKVEDLLRRAAA
jgi:Domain of unknown function DUF302